MVVCYIMTGESLAAARNRYRELYGDQRRVPAIQTILGVYQRLLDYGQFRPRNADAGRPRLAGDIEDRVLDYFRDNPHASTRDAGRDLGISHVTAWNVLHEEGQHPYHFLRVQELIPTDYEPRLRFCRWLVEEPGRKILWTDESTFSRVGLFNIHNAHWWSYENPRAVVPDHFQHRFSVNVWAGLIGQTVIGPVFLERLNGETYLQLLESVQEMLEDVPVAEIRDHFFQQDGAPAHYHREARAYLDATYPNHWIGRGGPIAWPPRSPDVTPLDFFLWGRVKDLVYGHSGNNIRNVDELKTRIISAFDVIKSDRDTLIAVQSNVIRRAHLCIGQSGGHFQHLL